MGSIEAEAERWRSKPHIYRHPVGNLNPNWRGRKDRTCERCHGMERSDNCVERLAGEDTVEAEIRVGIREPLELDPYWSTKAHLFTPDWSKLNVVRGIHATGLEPYHA